VATQPARWTPPGSPHEITAALAQEDAQTLIAVASAHYTPPTSVDRLRDRMISTTCAGAAKGASKCSTAEMDEIKNGTELLREIPYFINAHIS